MKATHGTQAGTPLAAPRGGAVDLPGAQLSRVPTSTPAQGHGGRVLVLADDAAGAATCASLEGAGFNARHVPRHAALAEGILAWGPQLVLVDALGAPADTMLACMAGVQRQLACPTALLVQAQTGESMTLAARCGADVLVTRPLDMAALGRVMSRENPTLGRRGHAEPEDPPALAMVGSSAPMREVWRLVMLAAGSASSVVVLGETGAGKEVVARALHRFSARKNGPFVAVNCAALPDALLESELFGHERGAFTGAASRHKGRFELADGGTLFLDEIGDLPLALQVKLLRVLQERTFERLGGTESIHVNARVIAATHRNLEEDVKRGRFRADLFYRLGVLSIHVPALRERRADILPLWNSFLAQGATLSAAAPPETSETVQRMLLRHDWPGNIRELQNVAHHALMVTGRGPILPADLPASLVAARNLPSSHGNLAGLTLAEVERLAILDTYESLGSVRAAAVMLGVSERKLHYRLREYESTGGLSPSARSQVGKRAAEMPVVEGPASPPLRVLLAEDDDEVRWALTGFLRSEGYDVVAVAGGTGVLEQLGSAMLLEARTQPADVIIADLRMPGLTGMQILEAVQLRHWKMTVVLITAFGDEDIRDRARELGAAALMDKPIDVVQLQRLLAQASAQLKAGSG